MRRRWRWGAVRASSPRQPDPLPAPDVPVPIPAPTATEDLMQRVRALEEELRRLHAPPGAPRPFADPQTETFEARWRNAFVIQSTDERFRLRLGGLVRPTRYFADRPATHGALAPREMRPTPPSPPSSPD